MNLQEWKAKRLREGQLPSGLDVKYKRVDLVTLIANGDLPTEAVEALQALDKAAGTVEIDATVLPEYVGIFNTVAEAVLVEPKTGTGADELNVRDLPLEDRTELFMWVKQGADRLAKSFREESEADGEKSVASA